MTVHPLTNLISSFWKKWMKIWNISIAILRSLNAREYLTKPQASFLANGQTTRKNVKHTAAIPGEERFYLLPI